MNLLVIGATGNVGQAVVLDALRRDWSVTAVARDDRKLKELSMAAGSSLLGVISADLSSDRGAAALAEGRLTDAPHAVVVTVNAWVRPRRMLEWDPADLRATWATNLEPHLVAARAFIPLLRPGGVFISVGGGTADHLLPGSAHLSLTQAALRMMVRAIAKEESGRGVQVKELLVQATVLGHRAQGFAAPPAIPASDVAARICDILRSPGHYRDAILTMP